MDKMIHPIIFLFIFALSNFKLLINMELNEEQLEKLKKALLPNLKQCPNCHSKENWNTSSTVFLLTDNDFKENAFILNTKPTFIPLVALCCPDCGYTQFFNAKILGLID